MLADPAFTLRLKQTMVTDLRATVRPVIDTIERRRVLTGILPRPADYTTAAGREPDVWIRKSPLIEVVLS